MENKIHHLKEEPKYFQDTVSGAKNCEIRLNDRDYKVGDILVLEEYINDYTGKYITVEVIYIIDYQPCLKTNCVVLCHKQRLDMGAKLI